MNGRAGKKFRYPTAASNTAHVSAFPNANGVRIRNFTTKVHMSGKSALEVLHRRVAPNAITNQGGRADDAKCHPGTRMEVIDLIEKWMNDAGSDRIFWMSGPAGGGKTAIMKTVAERSANGGVQTVNFFFFRGDLTRKSALPVVATLLYQLFERYPSSSEAVAKILSERPRILDGSIEEQCKLISAMFPVIREISPNAQITLLIDGLDECDVDAERSQPDIFRALERLVMQDNSPFRLLVASRPEARIQMAFNQLSSQARYIFLDGQFFPERDIRIFVDAEFNKIKSSHPLKHSLPEDWPPVVDIQAIVTKSSGQFIYAATVMRYIGHPYTVPSLSLERVMGIAQVVNNSPFTNIDNIYVLILSRVSDSEAMRDILSMKLLSKPSTTNYKDVLRWYNSRYDAALIESCVSELSAIVRFITYGELEFYHASLADFLQASARSGDYYLNIDAFRANVLTKLWRQQRDGFQVGTESDIFYYTRLLQNLLYDLQAPTLDITHMLLAEPICDWIITPSHGKSIPDCLFAIKALYYPSDIKTYKQIVYKVISESACFDDDISMRCPHMDSMPSLPHLHGFTASYRLDDIPYAQEYYQFYERWNTSRWFRLLMRTWKRPVLKKNPHGYLMPAY